ncbi:type II secretion system protein [Tepidibacter mesophilus]|uniref:type II secretion system protein n=1 Tax=Tepidibacter mesophilus TaxID=655607 RepID=UPI000C069367|nr:type II secretion system protein [Tepidibacter mesophilus]
MNNKGLTLIEIIISLALIQITVVVFMSIITTCAMINMKSKEKLEALNIAQQYIETIRQQDYENFIKYDDSKDIYGKYEVDTDINKKDDDNLFEVLVKVKKDEKEIVNLKTLKVIRR